MTALVKSTGYKSHKGGKVAKGIASMKAHLKYIEAPREKHENVPELFNGKGKVTRSDFFTLLSEQPERGVIAHKFVFSLSQDEADRGAINIREWVNDVMNSYEMKSGRNLSWCAAEHQDLDIPMHM